MIWYIFERNLIFIVYLLRVLLCIFFQINESALTESLDLNETEVSTKPEQTLPVHKLREATLQGVATYIKENGCKNIITIAGAGLSTSAGIPDVPTLDRIFNEMKDSDGYDENFDSLERKAGIHPEKLVEFAGSLYENSHCVNCSTQHNIEWLKGKVLANKIPRCSKCGDIVFPDIQFIGKNITSHYPKYLEPEEDFLNCDLLIIMGTRVVPPYLSWINWAPDDVPRLLINNELVGKLPWEDRIRPDRRPQGFDPKIYDLDIFWEGMCDDGCELLANELGWGNELRQLMNEGNEKIEKESTQLVKSTVSVTGQQNRSNNYFLSKLIGAFKYYWRIYVSNRIHGFPFMGKGRSLILKNTSKITTSEQ